MPDSDESVTLHNPRQTASVYGKFSSIYSQLLPLAPIESGQARYSGRSRAAKWRNMRTCRWHFCGFSYSYR